MPWNTFSTHGLVAFWVTITLAIIYGLIYCRRGRHLIDLLLAALAACTAVACLLTFLEDNVVPQGISPAMIDGADRAWLLLKVKYVFALLGMAFQFHFITRYCRRWTMPWRTALMYAAFLAQIPLVCSSWFFSPQTHPNPTMTDWSHAVPWQPIPGPLLPLCLMLWSAIQVYLHVVLWRYRNRTHLTHTSQVHLGLVRLAMIVQTGGVMMDITNGALGFTGVSMVPVTSIITMSFLGVAIFRRRADSSEAGQSRATLQSAPA